MIEDCPSTAGAGKTRGKVFTGEVWNNLMFGAGGIGGASYYGTPLTFKLGDVSIAMNGIVTEQP